MKLLPLLFFAGIFLSQSSCKVPSLVPNPTSTVQSATSDFILNVKLTGGDENYSRLMNALTVVTPPSDIQVRTYNSVPIVSQEISARYNAQTNTIMDKIQKEVLKCEGVSGVNIVRL